MSEEKNISLVWKYVYQPIGWKLVKIFNYLPITSLQISIILNFVTILAFFLIAYEYILVGMILLQFSLLLDVFDGAVARLKNQSTLKGIYMEAVWHECIIAFFYMALGIYSYKITNNPNYIIMGSLTAIFIPIINLLFHRWTMISGEQKGSKKSIPSLRDKIVRWLTCPSYTFTYGLILMFFNLIPLMVIFYFVLYLIIMIYKVGQFIK